MHFLARYIAIWIFFSGGYILNVIYLDSSMITSNGVPCLLFLSLFFQYHMPDYVITNLTNVDFKRMLMQTVIYLLKHTEVHQYRNDFVACTFIFITTSMQFF